MNKASRANRDAWRTLDIGGGLRRGRQLAAAAAVALGAGLAGCGGGGDAAGAGAPQFPPVQIGVAGGVVDGPQGARVEIPADALRAGTSVRIHVDDAGAPPLPALPAGIVLRSPMLALTPHGTELGVPALLSLPAGEVPADATVLLLKTNAARDGWQQLDATLANGRVTAPVTGFSNISIGYCFCGGAGSAPQPTIAMPPRGGQVDEGGLVLLQVDAIGAAPFTYQWLRSGRPLPGETSRTLVINPVLMADDGMRLSVTVTDTHGRSVTSADAVVRVRPALPVVSSQPLDVVAHAGSTAAFVAATTSSVPQTFQWERSNDGGTTWGAAPSQDVQLRLPNVQAAPDDGALFRLVASNPRGSVTTRVARLTVIPALAAPAVLAGPEGVDTVAGRSASFVVLASGGDLAYEWQRSDAGAAFTTVAGAPDAAAYTISNTSSTDDGARFRVVVRNALGAAVSAPARLGVAANVGATLARVGGGESHSLALRADGQLMAWGDNAQGQLGLGALTSSAPAAVPGLTDIATFGAGWRHSLAIRASGELVSFGDNFFGQLGDASRTERRLPVSVPLPAPARQVSGAPSSTVVLDGRSGYLATGSGIFGDGSVYTENQSPARFGVGVTFVRVASGRAHTLALRSDGTVWTWGQNSAGQLGNGSFAAQLVATPIAAPARVVAVAAGSEHSLLLSADGRVYSFGRGTSGQLGLGSNSTTFAPAEVALPGIVAAIAAGRSHSMALLADGRLYAWGSNQSGQVGDGSNLDALAPVRIDAAWTLPLQSVGAGLTHSLALDANGRVWAWGDNTRRQLGDGTSQPRNQPVEVPGLRLD